MQRLLIFIVSLVTGAILFAPGVAMAQDTCTFSEGTSTGDPFACVCDDGSSAQSSTCQQTGEDPITGKDQDGLLIQVTNVISLIAGISAVIVILIAAIQYTTSAGDASRVSQARSMVIYALVGIAVVVAGQGIVRFLLNKL